MKLTYFGIPGRAEASRLMLGVKKVPFTDAKVTREQWPEVKKRTKFGQLPILELEDGRQLAQVRTRTSAHQLLISPDPARTHRACPQTWSACVDQSPPVAPQATRTLQPLPPVNLQACVPDTCGWRLTCMRRSVSPCSASGNAHASAAASRQFSFQACVPYTCGWRCLPTICKHVSRTRAAGAQSSAIVRYVAQQTKFYPSDPWHLALSDEALALTEDITGALRPAFLMQVRPRVLFCSVLAKLANGPGVRANRHA